MDAHILKVYVPMTETGFYILLCFREESHGYNVIRKVEELTDGEIRISPGTMYGSLSKMEKDGPRPPAGGNFFLKNEKSIASQTWAARCWIWR